MASVTMQRWGITADHITKRGIVFRLYNIHWFKRKKVTENVPKNEENPPVSPVITGIVTLVTFSKIYLHLSMDDILRFAIIGVNYG